FFLADNGYDVWLGCHRGTSFSRGHITLNSNTDIRFWDFSFHEMGLYDFTAMVDHARMVSGNEKIFVIAHSQGASAFLVATSEIPSMNEQIHAAYLFAPGAFEGGLYEPITAALLPIVGTPTERLLYNLLGGRFSLRDTSRLTSALGIGRLAICQPKAIRCGVCDVYTLAPYYFNRAQQIMYVATNLPRMIAKLLDTGTFRSLFHFGQNARSCMFRKTPSYNLSGISVPMYIFWGEQDASVTPPDIQRLANNLPSAALRAVIRVNDDTFEHLDFLLHEMQRGSIFICLTLVLHYPFLS
ncbi:Lipase 3, partial [Orchesella cincta]